MTSKNYYTYVIPWTNKVLQCPDFFGTGVISCILKTSGGLGSFMGQQAEIPSHDLASFSPLSLPSSSSFIHW